MFENSRLLFNRNDTYSLRGLCMICIIFHHLYQFLSSKYGLSFPLPAGILLQNIGYLATGVFFIISGYGLFVSIKKNNPLDGRYIVKHLLNLYIPFLFVCIIQSIINLLQGCFTTKSFLTSLLLMSDFWFMRTIFLLYISVFLINAFKISTKAKITILSLGILGYVMISAFLFKIPAYWWNSILCFPAGLYCAYYADSINLKNTTKNGISVLIVFIFTFCLNILSKTRYCPQIIGEFTYPIFMVLSAISFSLYAIHFASVINVSNKVFNYFGTNSLCFYLYHFIFLKLCLFNNPFTYCISVWIGTIILVTLYRFIDKVCLSRITSSLLSLKGGEFS